MIDLWYSINSVQLELCCIKPKAIRNIRQFVWLEQSYLGDTKSFLDIITQL